MFKRKKKRWGTSLPPLPSLNLNSDDRRKRRKRMGKLIGKGWQGKVYLKDRSTVRKVYAFNPLSSRRRKVAREVEALSRLRRTGIAPKLKASGRNYLEMSFVPGKTLESKISDASPRRQRRYGRKVGKAIRKLHDQQVIHRDLHSKNIIVTRTGNLRVIDYGQARTRTRPLTRRERLKDINRVVKSTQQKNRGQSVDPFRSAIYASY